MTNLLARAINCSDGDQAAKIIQDALGIESDVANYCFLQTWPAIASSTPALLANGCIPRHVSWPHQGMRGNWMAEPEVERHAAPSSNEAEVQRLRGEQTHHYVQWTFFATIAVVIVGLMGVGLALLH
jgi:hypothetical protein